jgi:hypothetical protein
MKSIYESNIESEEQYPIPYTATWQEVYAWGESIVEAGCGPFKSDFNISYQVTMYKHWNPPQESLADLLKSAQFASSGLWNGENWTQFRQTTYVDDLCIITGEYDPSCIGISLQPGYAFVVSVCGAPIPLANVWQHEASHNYGCPDHYDPNNPLDPVNWINCIMCYDYEFLTGTRTWCNGCRAIIQDNINQFDKPPTVPTVFGSSVAAVNLTYNYYAVSIDYNEEPIRYEFQNFAHWSTMTTGWYDSGDFAKVSWVWSRVGNNQGVIVRAQDPIMASYGAWTDWSPLYVVNVVQSPISFYGPDSALVNETQTYSVTSNVGCYVSYNIDWGDGSNITTTYQTYSGLNVTVSHSWSSPGTYTIKGRTYDYYKEYSLWYPLLTVTILRHDVNLTNIFAPTQICQGDTAYIDVFVKNEGNFTETFSARVLAWKDSSTNYIIDTKTVSNLVAGSSITIPFIWNTAGVSLDTYRIYGGIFGVSGNNTGNSFYIGGTITIFPPLFVSITNPHNWQRVSGVVQITASASDADGVKQVQFYVDGNPIGTASAPTNGFYQCLWNTTQEASTDTSCRTIEAVAYDFAGNQNCSQITVWLDRHDVVITGTQYVITRPGCLSECPWEMEGWSAGAVYPDWGPLHAYVTVQNEGSYNESFTVVADPDNSSFYHSIFGIQNCTLAPDQSTTLDFVLNNFTGMPAGQSYMFAYWITGVPNETSAIKPFWLTSVNYLYIDWGTVITVRLPGDCNGDGIINMADLNIVKAALNSSWNCSPYPPYYDWRADFFGNGTVTMADYNIVMAALSPGTQGQQD